MRVAAFTGRFLTGTDIKLFVKLPGWFEINTPIGKYNSDWATVKHHDDPQAIGLDERETAAIDGLFQRGDQAAAVLVTADVG